MFHSLFHIGYWLDLEQNLLYWGVAFLFAFCLTYLLTGKLADLLPKDGGREFAHDGKLSAGKPRGAGIIFVSVFLVTGFLFLRWETEHLVYGFLLFLCMMTGFLDDAAKTPWNEYIKGFLDLLVAVATGIAYVWFNGTTIYLPILDKRVELNPILYVVLAVILVWTAINVTNCTDGVDSLSASLTIVSLTALTKASQYLWNSKEVVMASYTFMNETGLIFTAVLLGYLWYNATPSRLMMGDAGSRAMGLLLAIFAMESRNPLFFVPMALVIILDGGLGLLKVFLLRYLKISILKNTRTPLHDHVRKNKGWSNTQTVFRFVILQIVICYLTQAIVTFCISMRG